MNTTFKISLDVHRIESQVTITAFRGDSGYTIVASLTEEGRPFHLSDGCSAVFEGVKADGNFLCNACDVVNDRIVYDFKKTTPDGETCQTTAVPGDVKCQFKIIGESGAILSSPRFTIVVEDTIYNEEEIKESVSEATVLTKTIADLNMKVESGFFHGKDGYTPVKGVDYYTEAEKKELVDEILSNFVDGNEVAY